MAFWALKDTLRYIDRVWSFWRTLSLSFLHEKLKEGNLRCLVWKQVKVSDWLAESYNPKIWNMFRLPTFNVIYFRRHHHHHHYHPHNNHGERDAALKAVLNWIEFDIQWTEGKALDSDKWAPHSQGFPRWNVAWRSLDILFGAMSIMVLGLACPSNDAGPGYYAFCPTSWSLELQSTNLVETWSGLSVHAPLFLHALMHLSRLKCQTRATTRKGNLVAGRSGRSDLKSNAKFMARYS